MASACSFPSTVPEAKAPLARLRERLFDEFGNRYFPGQPVTSKVDAETAKKHAEQIAGSYFNSRGIRSKFLHILDLISPIAIGPDEDGKLSAPMVTNTGNKPRRWVEIEPYVWKDLDSGEKLAAKVENGEVKRWSFDTVSPFMMFDRAPLVQGSGVAGAGAVRFPRPALAGSAVLAGGSDRPASVQGRQCPRGQAPSHAAHLAWLAVARTGDACRLGNLRLGWILEPRRCSAARWIRC